MNETKLTKNLLIRASAGTGKTFAIATRFIWLFIVREIDPGKILALTFSRLAAQEIYTKILERLWRAAFRDESAATEDAKEKNAQREKETILAMIFGENFAKISREKIARALNGHALDSADFASALRKLINCQHLGTIATLDSFILKFVSSYPLELGFQNEVSLLDDYQVEEAMRETSEQLLTHTNNREKIVACFDSLVTTWERESRKILMQKNDKKFREFLRAYGSEKITLAKLREIFAIPSDLAPFDANGASFAKFNFDALENLAINIKSGKPAKNCGVAKNLSKFAEQFVNYSGEKLLTLDNSFGENFFAALQNDTIPQPLIFGTRQISLPDDFIACALNDYRRAKNLFLLRQCEKTIKMLELVALFETEYDAKLRRGGRLTFDDLPAAQARFSWSSSREECADALRNLEYRFDSQFDHWALDEFQDTNLVQWACLKPLIENAANDDEKSVITVGDLKQAIYSWRGGSQEPFLEMMRWPAISGRDTCGHALSPLADGSRIGEIQDKDISRRYEKNTCDFLNQLFAKTTLAEFLGTTRPDAFANWCDENCWREHHAVLDEKTGREKSGDYVKLIGVPINTARGAVNATPEEASDDDDEKFDNRTLREISPTLVREIKALWETHQKTNSRESVGVLVRRNEEGLACAKILRKEGLPVIWEGASDARDLPIVELVLALLSLAEHPEDSAAWGFFTFSPLPKWLHEIFDFRENTTSAEVSQFIAKMLSCEGLARTVQKLIKPIQRELLTCDDDESAKKLTNLLRAAVTFEANAKATDGIDAFKNYLSSHTNRTLAGSADFIRILTVHRSKGLSIDHVFVPIVDTVRANWLTKTRATTLTSENPGEWIFADFTERMSAVHPILQSAWNKQQNELTSETLHVYYVALTRAKKSLTVLVPILYKIADEKKGAPELQLKNKGFSQVLISAFWGGEASLEEKITEFGSPVLCAAAREKKTPSNLPPRISSTPFLPRENISARDIQKRVSPSKLNASDESSVQTTAHFSRNIFSSSLDDDAAVGRLAHAEFAKIEWIDEADASDDFSRVFVKPAADATVWREKAYELCAQNCWESGVIDRVVFWSENKIAHAMITDFKITRETNDEILANRYRAQLLAYRRAVQLLTGIADEKIAMQLLVCQSDKTRARIIPIRASTATTV